MEVLDESNCLNWTLDLPGSVVGYAGSGFNRGGMMIGDEPDPFTDHDKREEPLRIETSAELRDSLRQQIADLTRQRDEWNREREQLRGALRSVVHDPCKGYLCSLNIERVNAALAGPIPATIVAAKGGGGAVSSEVD